MIPLSYMYHVRLQSLYSMTCDSRCSFLEILEEQELMMHHRPAMIAIIVLPQVAVIDILFRSVALQFKESGGTSTWTLQPVALWLRIALMRA